MTNTTPSDCYISAKAGSTYFTSLLGSGAVAFSIASHALANKLLEKYQSNLVACRKLETAIVYHTVTGNRSVVIAESLTIRIGFQDQSVANFHFYVASNLTFNMI